MEGNDDNDLNLDELAGAVEEDMRKTYPFLQKFYSDQKRLWFIGMRLHWEQGLSVSMRFCVTDEFCRAQGGKTNS